MNSSFLPSAWIPVERGVSIPFDLESTPLQIKTDAPAAGVTGYIWTELYDAQDEGIANFVILFISPTKYTMAKCQNDWPVLPTQPPDDVDKIWTFTKTTTALIISCNGVELLNYVFSTSSDGRCVSTWSRDVEIIQFDATRDKASDYYRKLPTGKLFALDKTC